MQASEQPATKGDIWSLSQRIDGLEKESNLTGKRVDGLSQRINDVERKLSVEIWKNTSRIDVMENRLTAKMDAG